MRIAILADVPWSSGTAGSMRIRRWAEELTRLGAEVSVLPIGEYGRRGPSHSIADVHVDHEVAFQSKYGVLGRGGRTSLRQVRYAIESAKPDWVLCYGRRLSTIAACALTLRKDLRIAVDLTEHPSITCWERGLLSAAGWDHWIGMRLLLKRASVVVSITPALAEACRAMTRAPIMVAPGMAPDVGSQLRPVSFKFGYYGSWHPKDHPLFLAQVATAVLQSSPRSTFETVGLVPPAAIETLAALSPPSHRIVHHGRVPDHELYATLGHWSIAILPRSDDRSVRYAFPNRAAELLACGVPIAVRRTAQVSGITDPLALLAIDDACPEAAARAILSVMGDQQQLETRRKVALLTARTELCAHNLAKRAADLMRQISTHS
jgi:glycosyltransferase involved in cell wall biosynthesis